jgi:quercetin dioxygenase-like cupin family protein
MAQSTAVTPPVTNLPFHAKAAEAEMISWSVEPDSPMELRVLATGAQTGRHITVAEHFFQPGQGAGYHAHLNEDEGWYVLEGEITIDMPEEGERFVVPAGEFVWKPVKRMHNFTVTSAGPARVLQFLLPGTELVPEFFNAVGALSEDSGEAVLEAAERYGLVFGDPETGASDLPARTPTTRGSANGAKIKFPEVNSRSHRICNEPFQSDRSDIRPLEIGRGMMEGVKCTFHAFGHQTGNKFGLFEIRWGAGDIAYPHVHTLHEEGFYIVEGQMTLVVQSPTGLVEAVAKQGDFVWAPRDMPHYYIISGENGVRAVIFETPGGTLSEMFLGISEGQGKDIESDENLEAFAQWTADFVGMHFIPEGEFPGFQPKA